MAKKSKIAKNDQRRRIVEKHRERREALKATIASPHTTSEARAVAVSALARLPRDSSPTRIRNRDAVDGRPRAFNRTFGLSRINLRQMAHRGELPGVVKSSW